MRMSKLVGRRIKEDPKDAKTVSHKYLVRGGYIRQVSTGIYSLLPLGKRVQDKVEKIIQEEMNLIDGQEISMPVVNPADIWIESGRYNTIGEELLRFKNRNNQSMVLAMTHEEAVCQLARTEITSYKQLPVMMYQIQTKYRDEARPRAGLIRVREFRMKDAYSFHETVESLESYYALAHKAYENIFFRVGMHDCLSIQSDTGMIGGALAHEFMAVAECGEDTLFVSPCGTYKANREIAVSNMTWEKEDPLPLQEVKTPNVKSIEDVANFLQVPITHIGKSVCYCNNEGQLYIVMIRGDYVINEIKLKKTINDANIRFANDQQIIEIGSVPGFISPIGINASNVTIIIDPSVAESANLIVGANKEDYHFKNFNFQRDIQTANVIISDIRTVKAGEPCPITGQPLIEKRGIEIGNIFQLGTKYSKSMGVNYLDRNGKPQPCVMGCYGIGLGRTVASVIEQNYDDYGPIWPITIAPYHVHICALNPDKENVEKVADQLYTELTEKGIEVLYDDRGEKAGFMFNDADLIGIPFRFIISPKTLAEGMIEFKRRGQKESERWSITECISKIQTLIHEEMKKYQP